MPENMFGTVRPVEKLTFEIDSEYITVKRGGRFAGFIMPNGFPKNGAYFIDYELNEPILSGYQGELLSLAEMEQMIAAWKQAFPNGALNPVTHTQPKDQP